VGQYPKSPFDYATFERLAPAVVDALRILGQAVDDSGLEKTLTELLKVRVSQINGCAFCLQFHLNIARKLGVTPAKLNLVATWRDADIFSGRERSALTWAEKLTLMSQQHDSGEGLESLQSHFSLSEIGYLTAAVANINAWNRVAGGLHFPPPIPSNPLSRAEGMA